MNKQHTTLSSLIAERDALVTENQQLRDALERFYAEVDKAQRIDNTGGDSAVAVSLNSWDEYLSDPRGPFVRSASAGTPSEDPPIEDMPDPSHDDVRGRAPSFNLFRKPSKDT
jgi:hypothetical protein